MIQSRDFNRLFVLNCALPRIFKVPNFNLFTNFNVALQFVAHERTIKSLVFNFQQLWKIKNWRKINYILGLSIFSKRNLVSLWQRIVKKLPSWRKLSIDQRSGTRAFNRLRSTTLEQICKLPHRSIQGWSLNEERSLVWNPTLLDRQFIFKYVRI